MGNEKSLVNYMNCAEYDKYEGAAEVIEQRFREAFVVMPKLRYKLREVAGDYYYEMMSVEEALKKAFIVNKEKTLKNEKDID